MRKSLFKGKSTRTKMFAGITAAMVAVLLTVNLVLAYFGTQNLIYLDMTPEGFYTLSTEMKKACDEILGEDENGEKKNIKITFCTDPDYLTNSLELRVIYFMALAMRNMYDNLTVETVNIAYDPSAVAMYKTTSRQTISSSDIIVSYGAKYRIVNAASFWMKDSYSQDGGYFSYNGEYKMASILASLTAINSPAAYFVTDHNETYYDPSDPDGEMSLSMAYFADLLIERGLEIKTLELGKVDRIPDDCALLIINNPTEDIATNPEDYDRLDYVSDAEKIDRYLINDLGSLIVNKPYDVSLPVLESLLSEWGIGFGEGVVQDEDIYLPGISTDEEYKMVGIYDSDEESFGSAFYGDYASLSSAPDMIFSNAGYIYCSFSDGEAIAEPGTFNGNKTYSSFIGTTSGAIATESVGSGLMTADKGFKSLAAVSTRTFLDSYTNEKNYSYIFASNSESFFSNELLGNMSYANYDVMASVISNMSRTDRYASIDLGGASGNSPKFGGKQTVSTTLKDTKTEVYSSDAKTVVKVNQPFLAGTRTVFTVISFVAPTIILVLGAVLFIKRKYL